MAKFRADPAAAETGGSQQKTGKTWDGPSPKFPSGNKWEQLGALLRLCLISCCRKLGDGGAWVVWGGATIREAVEGINTAVSHVMSCQKSLWKEQQRELQAFRFKPWTWGYAARWKRRSCNAFPSRNEKSQCVKGIPSFSITKTRDRFDVSARHLPPLRSLKRCTRPAVRGWKPSAKRQRTSVTARGSGSLPSPETESWCRSKGTTEKVEPSRSLLEESADGIIWLLRSAVRNW